MPGTLDICIYTYIADYSSTVWRVPGMCNWQCKVKLRRPLTPSTVSRSISLSIYIVRFETGQQRYEKFETFTPQATQRFTRSLNLPIIDIQNAVSVIKSKHSQFLSQARRCTGHDSLLVFGSTMRGLTPKTESGNSQAPNAGSLLTERRRRLSFRSKRQQGILKCWKIL